MSFGVWRFPLALVGSPLRLTRSKASHKLTGSGAQSLSMLEVRGVCLSFMNPNLPNAFCLWLFGWDIQLRIKMIALGFEYVWEMAWQILEHCCICHINYTELAPMVFLNHWTFLLLLLLLLFLLLILSTTGHMQAGFHSHIP